jgi:hypothetical protein
MSATMKVKLQAGSILLICVTLALIAAPVLSQSGGGEGYEITRWNASAGGGRSASDRYTLDGTAGQPAADKLGGGDYTLGSGFWGGAGATQHVIYLPLVLKL